MVMQVANPYESPKEVGSPVAPSLPWSRVVVSSVLVFVGTCFLLLLDGQVFTNGLYCLGFLLASALLWAPDWRKHRLALLIHGLAFAALLIALPELHGQQKAFNDKVKEVRARQ
jgi:hypothetical protein